MFLILQLIKMTLKILQIFLLIHLSCGKISYENYKVYNVLPKTEVDVEMLNFLKKGGYDFWSAPVAVDKIARIMVSPAKQDEFLTYIQAAGLSINVSISNVQELIDAQMRPAARIDRSARLGTLRWDRYNTLEQIHAWLDELVNMYPGVVTTQVIGRSYEGREIKGVVIDLKAGQRENNSLIAMIEGGIHAREWISPATVTWIIKEFLTSRDVALMLLAKNFIWHIFPVINPDGYAYTFKTNRMWRKNRNPANKVACGDDPDTGTGIDLNRNFDFLWMILPSASSNPCDETFAGPTASSELETQAIIRHVLSLKQKGKFLYYIAFHSCSQAILIPYSHLAGINVWTTRYYGDMYTIAVRGAERLTQRHGTRYMVGTSAEILYEVTGTSFDWVKGVAAVPLVYLFELRDTGKYCFLLPPEQIIPNNEEIISCLVEMDKIARRLRYYSGTSSFYISIKCLALSIVLLIFL